MEVAGILDPGRMKFWLPLVRIASAPDSTMAFLVAAISAAIMSLMAIGTFEV
jgi:hypothetical protein